MTFVKKHPALTMLVALVAVWTLELFVVQERSLVPPFKNPQMLFTRQAFRFFIDLAFVTFLVFTVPRRLLYALFVVTFLAFAFGGVYLDYYGRLPRLTMLTGQAGEGAAIFSLVLGMMPFGRTTILLLVLAAKIGLVHGVGRLESPSERDERRERDDPPPRIKRIARWGSALVYFALIVIADRTFDPMTHMKKWGTTDRFGIAYGFAIPMVVEAYYAQSESLLERARQSAAESTDRLTPIEAPIAVHDRIVFLQVESLDYGVIDYRFDGWEVTPNLNRLKRRSMFYKAEAAHFTGSADADFVALMAVWPSRDIVTYKISGYPFDTALPHRLNAWGYETKAIHGVSGTFFDRRDGFSQMGVQKLLFKEELKERGLRSRHDRYDWIQDGDLYEFAAKDLAESPTPTLHLVITVTSHSPFKELPAGEAEKCAKFDSIVERYFCSMSYVDRGTGRYVDELPDDTTLVIYGDHNSSIEHEGYESGRVGERDWVPVLIYDTQKDLAAEQKSGDVATDGSLTFVDVMKYVHAQIDRKHRAASN